MKVETESLRSIPVQECSLEMGSCKHIFCLFCNEREREMFITKDRRLAWAILGNFGYLCAYELGQLWALFGTIGRKASRI